MIWYGREEEGSIAGFFNQVKENLAIPFLTAIGNHDLKVGSDKYQEIFGPTYYAFQTGQSHFIVLDTSTEERFDTAERQWLEEELKKSQTSEDALCLHACAAFRPKG